MLSASAGVLVAVVILTVWLVWPRATEPVETAAHPTSATASAPVAPQPVAPPQPITASRSRTVDSADPQPSAPPGGSNALGTAAMRATEPAAMVADPAQNVPETAPAIALEGEVEELVLQISAHSTVWLSITADGEPRWQGTLEPNQSRKVQASESIRLKVGNAGGVELTLNGREIPPLGREGEVRTLTLAAQTTLQDPAPQQ